ncbi:MAG: ferredoxin--NADP reductase [Gallionellaceae bacterium]|nr:ferredoxin--NADP reductase [Gallionellaceae bacterium]
MSKWVAGKIVEKKQWTDKLYSLRIEADIEPFEAGQFGKLALEIDGEMVARPYSYVNAPHERPLDFYFITVEDGPFTQRLNKLERGDQIFLTPHGAGFLVLSELPSAQNLWLLCTGTALGPFLSIMKTAEPWRRFTNVIFVHAVRYKHELTYQDTIARIRELHPQQFHYIPFVSREETDFAMPGRVMDAIADGRLEKRAGLALTTETSQVMICGNPDMVRDTIAALSARGMKKNRRREPGHITIENYW